MHKNISRRELIKTLIAGSGGIAAASFLPEKWLKPVVKSGVLPVHAQASAPDHNYVKGFINTDQSELLFLVSALVSSRPFTQEIVNTKGSFKLASPARIPIDYDPVEGEDVTLYLRLEITDEESTTSDYIKISTKVTDVDGYVEWKDEDFNSVGSIKSKAIEFSVYFKFEIIGDADEVKFSLFELNQAEK